MLGPATTPVSVNNISIVVTGPQVVTYNHQLLFSA